MGFLGDQMSVEGRRRAAVQPDCPVSAQDGWVRRGKTGLSPGLRQAPEMACGERESQCLAPAGALAAGVRVWACRWLPLGVGSSAGGQLPSLLPPPGVNLQPQLASVTFATTNPTLTTVALEKPLCTFDSSAALHGTHGVCLYVLVDSGKGALLPSGCSEGGFDLSVGRRGGAKAKGRSIHAIKPPQAPHWTRSGICSVPALGWGHLPWRDIESRGGDNRVEHLHPAWGFVRP